jgi:hypothetical protein
MSEREIVDNWFQSLRLLLKKPKSERVEHDI